MIIRACVVVLMTLLPGLDGYAQPAPVDHEITHIRGGLYRLRSGAQHTVFLVTAGGIVLVDPISVQTAQWLQSELTQRFPPGIVRYVLHTVHRLSRANGSQLFDDAAEVVGHREFNDAHGRALRAAGVSRASTGNVDTHFDDRRMITVGGSSVELVHDSTSELPEATIVRFPAERIAFTAEVPLVDRTPFAFGPFKPRDVNRWLATVAALDFDVLLLGDGRSIPKADLVRLSSYVADLVTRVAADYEAGRSAADFTEPRLPQTYRSDARFRDWRANVADAYRDVGIFRIDTTVGATAGYFQRGNRYCETYTSCSTGGAVPGVSGGLSASFGRWSLAAEVTGFEEVFSSRTSRFYDDEFALRETRVGVLIRRDFPAGPASLRLLGGMTYSKMDRRGFSRIKEGFAPFAGRHPIEATESRYSVTSGIDLAIGRGLGIVFPIRVNYAVEAGTETWPSRFDAQAGMAFTLRLFRSVD